ncbi:MAG: GxxExxY protein [Burkholderiaceae bacterium]|nr:MAG: GxxExxY protein [Burkholderiaceae bacterium]
MEEANRRDAENAEENLNALSGGIINAAIEVHQVLGPGLLESIYEHALAHELSLRGWKVVRQTEVPAQYKGLDLGAAYRLDLLVEDRVIVEIKAADSWQPIHTAQILTYLKLLDKRLGLLMNFNCKVMRDGIKRVVNNF